MVVGLQGLIEILRNICKLIAATGQVLRYSVGEHWSRVPMVVQSAALLRAAAWRRDGLRLGEERRKGVQVGRIGRGSWLRTAIACLAPAPLCAAIVEHHDLARCEGRLRELFEVPQSLLGIATSIAGAIAVSFPLSAHHASAFWDEPHRPCGAPMSDRVAAVTKTSSPSIEPIMFAWSWRGTPIPVGYELSGPVGAEPLLMLPAMSTVSTRDELRALAHHLETRRCVITDWPGFGDTARPRLDYDRALCRGFLEDLVAHLRRELERPSFPVVACGHAAGYAIDLEARQPGTFTHLVLIAPTWRGPLPTMMSGRKPIQQRIRRLIHAPIIGELLYRLNVSRPVVRMMYRRHVFADPAFLTDDLLADRMRLTRQPGARFASACFVTGALDPFDDRAAFLAAARRVQARC